MTKEPIKYIYIVREIIHREGFNILKVFSNKEVAEEFCAKQNDPYVDAYDVVSHPVEN